MFSLKAPIDFLKTAGLGDGKELHEYSLPGRKDRIWVVPLDSKQTVGLITYEKEERVLNGTGQPSIQRRYVHTLNTESGFQRKLHAVGIHMQENATDNPL